MEDSNKYTNDSKIGFSFLYYWQGRFNKDVYSNHNNSIIKHLWNRKAIVIASDN